MKDTDRPLRVLVAHNFRDRRMPSGENAEVTAEITALMAIGHEVTLVATHNEDVKDSRVDAATAALRGLLPRRWSHVLPDDIGDHDVAHVHNVDPQWGLGIVGAIREAGVPVVRSVHNWSPVCANSIRFRDGRVCDDCCTRTLPTPAIRNTCMRTPTWSTLEALRLGARNLAGTHTLADLTLAMSPSHAAGLSRFGFAGPLAIQGNIVDVDLQAETPLLTERDPGVTWVGRLDEQKGFAQFVALAEMVEGTPFVAYGDGPLRAIATDAVAMAGTVDLPTLHDALRTAAIVVAPSIGEETFGRTIVEAAAAGAWVIAFDHGGMGDLLRDGLPGTAVPLEDGVDGLARAVRDQQATMATMTTAQARDIRQAQVDAVRRHLPLPVVGRLVAHYRTAMAAYRRP